jgi:hypothetical protein
MAHAAEDRFRELRLAPSAYPTHVSIRFDICNECKRGITQPEQELWRKQNTTKAYRLLFKHSNA